NFRNSLVPPIRGLMATDSTPCLYKNDLTKAPGCNTLLDMKSATLTIRLDKDLNVLLSKASKRSGRNRSEIVREALRRQLRLQQFEEVRKRIMPFAEARGFLTDEDIFSRIS
ncbi:MAG TPA: CopG family transcriptional regulator, partial [Syntrophales bacterium]|nr:CopG family transcriptional regulator [Syntrophales bacterium]